MFTMPVGSKSTITSPCLTSYSRVFAEVDDFVAFFLFLSNGLSVYFLI